MLSNGKERGTHMGIAEPKLAKELWNIEDFDAVILRCLEEETPLIAARCGAVQADGGDFSGLDLRAGIVENSALRNCSFENASFTDVIFSPAIFQTAISATLSLSAADGPTANASAGTGTIRCCGKRFLNGRCFLMPALTGQGSQTFVFTASILRRAHCPRRS